MNIEPAIVVFSYQLCTFDKHVLWHYINRELGTMVILSCDSVKNVRHQSAYINAFFACAFAFLRNKILARAKLSDKFQQAQWVLVLYIDAKALMEFDCRSLINPDYDQD
ncbi:MAG: hypothetical protein QGG88_08200 [Gammaproteobacteria bacterium]|nr:hypothetical protein [Gammaproteobacteria bacterium]